MSSHSKCRPARRPFLLSALACGLLAVSGVSAQQPVIDDKEPAPWHGYSDPNVPFSKSGGHAVLVGGHATTGVATATVNHGRPGGLLKVATRQLPANATAQISLGAIRDGFEVVKTGFVDMGGRFNGRDTVEVTVPTWVRNDRPYLLMVTDLEYHPFAPAAMVHPTDARGMIRRTGLVKREPTGGCLTLTGEADELYFLTGDTGGLTSGEEVRIEGRPVQNTRCGTGTTIEVRSARLATRR
jgi:hypothetical protein